jgi:hypothetical protein
MPLDPGSVPKRRLRTEYTSAAYRQGRYLASRRLITLGRTRRGGRNRRCHLRDRDRRRHARGCGGRGATARLRGAAGRAPGSASRTVRRRSSSLRATSISSRCRSLRSCARASARPSSSQARGARCALLMAVHPPRSYARCKAHGRARRSGRRRRSPRRRCSPPVHRPIPRTCRPASVSSNHDHRRSAPAVSRSGSSNGRLHFFWATTSFTRMPMASSTTSSGISFALTTRFTLSYTFPSGVVTSRMMWRRSSRPSS